MEPLDCLDEVDRLDYLLRKSQDVVARLHQHSVDCHRTFEQTSRLVREMRAHLRRLGSPRLPVLADDTTVRKQPPTRPRRLRPADVGDEGIALRAAQEALQAEAQVLREETQRITQGKNAQAVRAHLECLRAHMERLHEFHARLEMLHAAGGRLVDADGSGDQSGIRSA